MYLSQKFPLMKQGKRTDTDRRRILESQQNGYFTHEDTINHHLEEMQQQQLKANDLNLKSNTSKQRNPQYFVNDKEQPLRMTIKKSTIYCCLCTLVVLLISYVAVYKIYFGQHYLCPSKYVVNYVWIGDRAKMPSKYLNYLSRCKNNVNLLQQKDLKYYINLWNSHQPQHQITPQNFRQQKMIADKADLLRKLYLYYESGIYADFDTEINEQCFDGIITNQIIFTNSWGFQRNIVMAQQNFIRVINKKNPYMRYWIIAQLSEINVSDNRWNLCKYKPCFIINCQKHNYDRTWIG